MPPSGLLNPVIDQGLFSLMILLAQEGGGGGAGGGGAGLMSFLPFLLILMLAYFLFIVPQQQKDKRYRAMVEGLKEKDHVVTTGGIYGVVTSVQREQERVTIRIDDATGAKMRVGMWAIARVLSDEGAESGASSGQEKSKK